MYDGVQWEKKTLPLAKASSDSSAVELLIFMHHFNTSSHKLIIYIDR